MRIDKQKLELAMARACMGLPDLMTAAAMPRATLNGVINTGREVRPATVGKIAKALNVDVTEILED